MKQGLLQEQQCTTVLLQCRAHTQPSTNTASATQPLHMHAEKCIATTGGHFEQLP